MKPKTLLTAALGAFVLASVGVLATKEITKSAAGPAAPSGDAEPAPGTGSQVIAYYFHRTVRCPTCQKISAYIEESLKTGLAAEMKESCVEWVMIDFQDPKNQQYTDAYQITGPTLVVMDVNQGKVTAWKPAAKVWSLVGDKEAFLKYVQNEVRAYLDPKQAGTARPSAK